MRCVASNGDMLGVMETREAMKLAIDQGLDLVEISPNADPPVCRIMDFGKFRYEESMRQKKARLLVQPAVVRCVPGCGRTFASRASLGQHRRGCALVQRSRFTAKRSRAARNVAGPRAPAKIVQQPLSKPRNPCHSAQPGCVPL